MRPATLLAALVLLAAPALIAAPASAREPGETIAAFYDALRTADATRLRELMSEDAIVRLADLGFDMTRDEFVDSMDVWGEVMAGATMRVRPDPDAADTVTSAVRIVCYEFPSNTVLTREVTTLRDGLIARNEQEEIGTACEGF